MADEDAVRHLSGGLVGTAAPAIEAGQAAPSAVRDLGGSATADAGTGGAGKHGFLSEPEREALRSTLAAAHPDAVHEMIRGETVGEMIASLASAKAAYAAAIATHAAGLPVSAGGAAGRTMAVDVSKLSPFQKISYGLRNG